jgi:hypothetical protein
MCDLLLLGAERTRVRDVNDVTVTWTIEIGGAKVSLILLAAEIFFAPAMGGAFTPWERGVFHERRWHPGLAIDHRPGKKEPARVQIELPDKRTVA